jgi:beta-glucosidase
VWYPGQEGGNAVADVIFGNRVPAGKLPITFPVSDSQLPDYENYSMKGRTYRYMTEKPLYPFGYGLSYTKFSLGPLQLDRQEIAADEPLTVTVDLENAGEYDGAEVVQLYITVPDPRGNQPLWSLKDFQRVEVPRGGSVQVTFEVVPEALQQINEQGVAEILPGTYTVHVGNSSPGERSRELGMELVSGTFQVN